MEDLEEDGEKRATGKYLLALVDCPSFFQKVFFLQTQDQLSQNNNHYHHV
jgi:hypothetical protein